MNRRKNGQAILEVNRKRYKSRTEVIMDDENNFRFDGDNMPDSARYYTNDKAKFSDDVRFIKILMRIHIYPIGACQSPIFAYLSQTST